MARYTACASCSIEIGLASTSLMPLERTLSAITSAVFPVNRMTGIVGLMA